MIVNPLDFVLYTQTTRKVNVLCHLYIQECNQLHSFVSDQLINFNCTHTVKSQNSYVIMQSCLTSSYAKRSYCILNIINYILKGNIKTKMKKS